MDLTLEYIDNEMARIEKEIESLDDTYEMSYILSFSKLSGSFTTLSKLKDYIKSINVGASDDD